MTISRRHVLGWGALGASAVALDGCGALPWARSAGPAPADVDRVLGDLDAVVAQLAALEPDPSRFGVKRENAKPEGTQAVKQLLTTVCFLGSYRDVPPATWAEPRVAARLADTLPRIHATVEKARAYIDGLSPEESARIERKLERDPDLPMRIMERVDEYAKQVHVPFEQRMYLRTATGQLAGRFRYEGIKPVTSKLSERFARTLAARKADLGMTGDDDLGDHGGGGDAQSQSQHPPVRLRFHTRATADDLRAATCALTPTVRAGGEDRRIVLDWEESRCPTTASVTLGKTIHGAVHLEPGAGGDNLVTIVLDPPADTEDIDLVAAGTAIGHELQKHLDARAQHYAGLACATTSDCGPLHCIGGVCADPNRLNASPSAAERLGSAREACRTTDDCESGLFCTRGICSAEQASSAKLIKTTGKVAKWGAIFLIPPLCAIGVLILLVCLFMVIVAGFEYAGGD